jgi:hypothetical protein
MKAIATLIPLVGFAQFWFQTDYLPRTSVPVVDLTTEMSPLGQTDDIVQLEAKVTINNRNSVPVYVGATLMRITAYPRDPGKPTPVSDAIEFGYIKSHAYRDKPLSFAESKLLYAKDLLPAGSPLAAGQSLTFRRVVDFDSHTMRLARLAVDAFFITNPRVAVYTCPSSPGGPQKSTKDGPSFENDISTIMVNENGAHFLCREIRLAPQNVVHELVGDRPSWVIEAILSDPKNQTKNIRDYSCCRAPTKIIILIHFNTKGCSMQTLRCNMTIWPSSTVRRESRLLPNRSYAGPIGTTTVAPSGVSNSGSG